MPKTRKHNLEYWNESLLNGVLPRAKKNRYLIFDIDQGGLNNIRLAFEYVAVIAAITGRTLVVPHPSSWYLINYGAIPDEHQGGVTEFSNIFDISALRKAIPVISTTEFINQAKSHLSIPEEFDDPRKFSDISQEIENEWKEWLHKNSSIPDWNPYHSIICHPTIEAVQNGPHMDERYVDNRQKVVFTPRLNAAPILYFPSNDHYRYLGPVATMFAAEDDTFPTIARRFIKHHIRYNEEIFRLAGELIEQLGIGSFDALQVRRNDFQYTETRLGADKICKNIGSLFDLKLPIYVATDETRASIFADLASGLNSPRILCWKDVESVCRDPIPFVWIGLIEQLICSAARRFVGTDLSTFTSYINRLRGYVGAEDSNIYFHNMDYSKGAKPLRAEDFRGRDYLRENPIFWLNC